MSDWNKVSKFVKFTTKGITPSYVNHSSIIVLNQKCIRNNKIDYSFSQYTDDKKNISLDKFVKKGDILVNSTGTGTAGRSAFVFEIPENYKLIVDSHILLLRCNSFYEAQCLNYVLFSFEKTLMSFMTGSSGQSELDKVVLLGLLTKLTDNPDVQKKIAFVLSVLDSKIEFNNKINTELESMAKTLYDYWFIQFDFPDENGKPYKSSGGKMVWNEDLKREIPKGWKVENLKKNSIATLIKPNIDKFEGEKIYLATADVDQNIINNNTNKITYQKRESRANMQPIENSIWFAKMKNSKKVLSFFDYSEEYLQKYILSTGFAGLKCEKYTMEYLWNFINNQNFEFIKDRLANGATQEAINNDSMEFIPLIIPNVDIVKTYHRRTYEIYKKVYINQLENQKLTELRDWLLPMLMNGQVMVS